MQRVGLLVGPCYIKQAWAIVALVTFLTANNTIFIPVAAQNDPCYICGGNPEASIANPDAVISLPPDSPLPTATCSQIEAAGLAGIVTSEQCAQIQDTTGETCGCSNHVQALTGGRPGEDAIEPTPTTPTLFSTETLLPTVGQDRVVPTGTPNVEPDTPTEAPSLELVEGTQPPTFDQGLGIPTIAPVVPTLLEPPTVAPTIEEIEPTVLPTMMPIINTTTNAPVVVAVAACTASQFANDDCVDRIDSYCDVGGLCNANTDCIDCDPCQRFADNGGCFNCVAQSGCHYCHVPSPTVNGQDRDFCTSSALAALSPDTCRDLAGTAYTTDCNELGATVAPGGDGDSATEVPGNATEVPGNATEVPGNATELLGNATEVPGNATEVPASDNTADPTPASIPAPTSDDADEPAPAPDDIPEPAGTSSFQTTVDTPLQIPSREKPDEETKINSDPLNGAVSLGDDGSVNYFPNPGYDGKDSFTLQICSTTSDTCRLEELTVTVVAAESSSSSQLYWLALLAVLPLGAGIALAWQRSQANSTTNKGKVTTTTTVGPDESLAGTGTATSVLGGGGTESLARSSTTRTTVDVPPLDTHDNDERMTTLPQSVLAHPVGDAFGNGGHSTTRYATNTTGPTKQLQQVTAMATLVEATPDYKDQCQQQQPAVMTAVAAVARSPGMRHALDPPTEQPLVNVFRVDDSDEDDGQV